MSGQFATKYVILRDLKYYYYFHFLENEIALPQNCKEDLICKFGFAESPQTSGLYWKVLGQKLRWSDLHSVKGLGGLEKVQFACADGEGFSCEHFQPHLGAVLWWREMGELRRARFLCWLRVRALNAWCRASADKSIKSKAGVQISSVNGVDLRIHGIRGLGERPWFSESLPVIRCAWQSPSLLWRPLPFPTSGPSSSGHHSRPFPGPQCLLGPFQSPSRAAGAVSGKPGAVLPARVGLPPPLLSRPLPPLVLPRA